MSCNFCYTLLFNYNEHAYICSGEKDNIKPGVASSDTSQCNSQLCPAPALPQTSHLCRSPSPPYRARTAEEQPSWGASAPGALIHQGWPGIPGSWRPRLAASAAWGMDWGPQGVRKLWQTQVSVSSCRYCFRSQGRGLTALLSSSVKWGLTVSA